MDFRFDKVTVVAETRNWGTGVVDENNFGAGLKALFESSNSGGGWCQKINPDFPLTNRKMCGSDKINSIWKIDFVIYASEEGYY